MFLWFNDLKAAFQVIKWRIIFMPLSCSKFPRKRGERKDALPHHALSVKEKAKTTEEIFISPTNGKWRRREPFELFPYPSCRIAEASGSQMAKGRWKGEIDRDLRFFLGGRRLLVFSSSSSCARPLPPRCDDEVEVEDEVSLRCQVEVGSLLHVRLRLHSGRKQVVQEKKRKTKENRKR